MISAAGGGPKLRLRPALSGFVCVAAVAGAILCGAGSASANTESPQPWWGLTVGARPTSLPRGGTGTVVVTAQNLGDEATHGNASIALRLPAGLQALEIEAHPEEGGEGSASCDLGAVTCTFTGSLSSYHVIEVDVTVRAEGVGGVLNASATVSGGGAQRTVSVNRAIPVGESTRFGIESYTLTPEAADGSIDSRAGSHPFQLTSVFTLNATLLGAEQIPWTVAPPRTVITELPPGLIADPSAVEECGDEQLLARTSEVGCPLGSAVGMATVTVAGGARSNAAGVFTRTTPIYNLRPPPGQVARFGLTYIGVPLLLDAFLHFGAHSGVTISASNITQAAAPLAVRLTFWGVPGDSLHSAALEQACSEGATGCGSPTRAEVPLLTMPASCGTPFQSAATATRWGTAPTSEEVETATYQLPLLLTGCEGIPFNPAVTLASESSTASAPTGLTVDLTAPQQAGATPEGIVESPLRDLALTLPEGVTLNPAATSWLAGCEESQVGFLGVGAGGEMAFSPARPEPFCPGASQIGRVSIRSPLLARPLQGAVYLASPAANPFGSMVAIYVVAEEPESGVDVKLAGEVSMSPDTGQLTISLSDLPQLPFSELTLELAGGPRAPLSTPPRCGSFPAQATLTPWSGTSPVSLPATIRITTGPGDGACPGALPFQPRLTAGMVNDQAGSSSALIVRLSRQDGERALGGLALTMPPGLSAEVAGVAACGEPAAAQGRCGSASKIGAVQLALGVGAEPAWLGLAGEDPVYLTGPYDGKGGCAVGNPGCAPFGLAIVVNPVAGPFDLSEGGPAVVRAKVEVDPRTAQLRILTGSLPSILRGVPLDVKELRLEIDRPGFILNPTSCAAMRIAGTATSSQDGSAGISSRFQAAGCAGLPFKPKLAAHTPAGGRLEGHGASLSLHLRLPAGANLRRLKLTLPKRLAARLQTIQHACPEGRFAKSPSLCPKASRVGHVSVRTPLLPALPSHAAAAQPSMRGAAYLLAKEGKAARGNGFPNLVLALHGDGVRLDLSGSVYVSAKNVTSVTFRSLPDVPIRRLDLRLPEGRRSLLAAGRPLCRHRSRLRLRVVATAQNGARARRSVKVAVHGCGHDGRRGAGRHRGRGRRPERAGRRGHVRPRHGRRGSHARRRSGRR